jgi:hypothetical protein
MSTALAMLDDPSLAPDGGMGDLSYLFPEEQDLALGAAPDDYIVAPKPKKEDVLAAASDLQSDHSVRLAQSKEYSHFLDCVSPGTFKEDEQLIKDDIVEVMPLLGEREAYEFRCGWIAMHDLVPRLLNRDALDRDEALAVEDLVSFDFQCEERQHARQYRGDLRTAEPAHLQRFGLLAGLDVLDPTDEVCGLDMQLLDPLTIFWVSGGPHGMLEVYRVYEDTNESIIGTYGGPPGYKEYERIRRKVESTANKTRRGKRSVMARNQRRTVTEMYNADWFQVILDEEVELVTRKHSYRRVPITIWIGGFDQPPGISIGAQKEYMGRPTQVSTNWGDVTVSSASVDLARQLRPYNWRQVWAHRIAEAVSGRRLSIYKWAIDPHKVLEYDPSQEWRMAEEVDLLPGETTRLPLPNKLNLVSPIIDPNIAAGLAADLQSNVGAGFLTQMRTGMIPPQTSGSALGKMAAMGGASESSLVRGIQMFKQMRAEARLELRKNFGDAIGKPLGIFKYPNSDKWSASPLHAITPKMLTTTGTQVDVELYYWQPDVALAQYLATLRTPSPTTGKPLISDDTARRKLRATADIEREADRIDDEALMALPPVTQQRHMSRLERELDDAMTNGDDDTAADLMIAIAELQFMHDQAVATGAAAPPNGTPPGGGGMMPPPQAMPPPGGGGGGAAPAPALPGTSLPESGIAPGGAGGRPPITPVGPPSEGGP